MRSLPTGTITFLYTDIQGSTRLWQEAPSLMPGALERHDTLLRQTIEDASGVVFRTMGDAFCAAFVRAGDAIVAATAAQRALLAEPWPDGCRLTVRMAIHAGNAEVREGDYVGHTLNRVARLLAAGHGGQTLVSGAVAELAGDRLPSDLSLRDLGRHRLKDLVRPEHIYQLCAPGLPDEFPPLATLDARPTNLPTQPTAFVGREREVETVVEMVRDPDTRLVTLTGPGGAGKTRLALQVGAEALEDYPDGVYFVPLGDVADPARVPAAISQALALRDDPEKEPLDALVEHLREREMLLILDNFEQIVEAAPTVSQLAAAAPRLTVLVTSRVVLRLSGEREYAVPALSLPDTRRLPSLEAFSQYDAVALFIERARAVRADFAITNDNAPAVAEICVRLDGLPLAIELAAARIRLFPPGPLLHRLDRRLSLLTGGARDLPARQQTLRGAIEWSYDLLEPSEQRLLARLSVFDGGCTLEAAEAVCNADGDLELDVLDGIASLTEKSLLRRDVSDPDDEPRFVMLETIREYASEKLVSLGEADALREWHSRFFMDLARAGYETVWGRRNVGVDRLVPDNANLISALDWVVRKEDAPASLRLAAYLCWLWLSQGLWHEGRVWSEAALSISPAGAFPAERGLLLWGYGNLAAVAGDIQTGIARMVEGHHLLEGAGDSENATLALAFVGTYKGMSGDIEGAIECLERALALARKGDDAVGIYQALGGLARTEMVNAEYAPARRHAEEALALSTSMGMGYSVAHILNLLGDISRLEGKYAEASDHYTRALVLSTESGFTAFAPSFRHNLAWAAHGREDDARARELFFVSVTEFLEMQDERGVAECLIGLGCAAEGPEIAAQLFGAGFALLDKGGMTLSRPNQRDYDRSAGAIRQTLGEERWSAAWCEGATLTVEEALALVAAPAAR